MSATREMMSFLFSSSARVAAIFPREARDADAGVLTAVMSTGSAVLSAPVRLQARGEEMRMSAGRS